MAGSGRRTFAPGEVLTASNVMNYLQDQAVMVFAGTAARGSAIGSAVSEGMVSYLKDSNEVQVYYGSSWDSISQIKSPNFVINGGFDIWQRGTSQSYSGTSSGYLADRWLKYQSGTGNLTVSKEAWNGFDSGDQFLRTNVTSSGYTYSDISTKLEGVSTLSGKTVVLSWWQKGTSADTVTPRIEQFFGSGGSSTVTKFGSAVSQSATWTRYSQSFTLDSTAGKTIGLNDSLIVKFVFGTSGTGTFDIAGVQLEEGSVATLFRRNANSLQGELAACQRYYYRTSGDTATRLSLGQAISTTAAQCVIYFPVTMRVAPTALEQSGTASHYTATAANGGILTCNAVPTFTIASLDNAMYSISVASGLVAGSATQIRLGSSSGYLAFSAEL